MFPASWLDSAFVKGFEFFSSFITLVGGVYLFWDYFSGQRTAESLGDIAGKSTDLAVKLSAVADSLTDTEHQLGLVAKSLSTHHVGQFPHYLNDVAAMIDTAEESIRIMALGPAHGSFTAKRLWHRVSLSIVGKIQEKIPKLNNDRGEFEAILLFGSKECFEKAFEAHHRELRKSSQKWSEWKNEEKEHIIDLLQSAPEGVTFESLTLDEYLQVRLDGDTDAIQKVYARFKLWECEDALPLYCWIVDNRCAIFSFRKEDRVGHYSGAGVYTSDSNLVGGLVTLFEHYREWKSEKVLRPRSRP